MPLGRGRNRFIFVNLVRFRELLAHCLLYVHLLHACHAILKFFYFSLESGGIRNWYCLSSAGVSMGKAALRGSLVRPPAWRKCLVLVVGFLPYPALLCAILRVLTAVMLRPQALCVLCGYFCDKSSSDGDGHATEVRTGAGVRNILEVSRGR